MKEKMKRTKVGTVLNFFCIVHYILHIMRNGKTIL